MTISTTTRTKQYNGDNSTTIFAYDFDIQADSELEVYLGTPVGAPTSWALQTITTDYTVSGAGDAGGGNVTFVTAPPTGTGNVFIRRVTAKTQTTDWVENDPTPSDSFENATDKLTQVTQDMQEELDRCLKLGDSSNPVPDAGTTALTEDATNRANKYPYFDNSGDLALDAGLGTWQGTWATSTAYVIGDIVKDTNPTPNVIYRCNTAHTSTGSLPISSNADSAKWTQIVSDGATGATGSTGSTGAAGADGIPGGLDYNFDTDTADSDSGNGKLWVNNATLSSVTELYISDQDSNSTDVSSYIGTWDDSSSATNRGAIIFKSQATPEADYAIFYITSAITDQTTYQKMTVSHQASAGTFSDGEAIQVEFVQFGDAAGGGTWTLIGTQEASASASLTQTGLDSTYDTYVIELADIAPADDGVNLRLRVGDSGGIDSGASDYSYHHQRNTHAAGTYAAVQSAGNTMILLSSACGNAAGEGYGGTVIIHRPGDGTTMPTITWHGLSIDDTTKGIEGSGTGFRTSAITLDRVQIFFSSGNIASGRMSVYGIKHT